MRRIGQGDAARPAVVGVESLAPRRSAPRARGWHHPARAGPRRRLRSRRRRRAPGSSTPRLAPRSRLRDAEIPRRRRRRAKLHPAAAHAQERPARRPVERPAVLRQVHERAPRGPVHGALQAEAAGHLLVRARQPPDERDRRDRAQVHLRPTRRPVAAGRCSRGSRRCGPSCARSRPPPSLAVTRNVAGPSSRTGGATSAKSVVGAAEPAHAAEREARRPAPGSAPRAPARAAASTRRQPQRRRPRARSPVESPRRDSTRSSGRPTAP